MSLPSINRRCPVHGIRHGDGRVHKIEDLDDGQAAEKAQVDPVIRRAAAVARHKATVHVELTMLAFADSLGLGDWYRHDVGQRKRMARFRREMAGEAYWGVTTRRPVYGGVCGA